MKTLVSLFVVLIGLTTLSAQNDPEAKKILDKLSEKTKSYKVIKTDFSVDYKNIRDDIQSSSSGTIIMKGNKYRLNFMGSESFFDGKTMWSYLAEVNEVNITEPEPDEEDIFSNPKRLFTIYENDYKYQLIESKSEDDNYSLIDLYPENLDEEYSRIRLQVNTNEYLLTSATIFGKDGSHYTISIFNYETNLNFEDLYFVFDKNKHPDIEVIDMR